MRLTPYLTALLHYACVRHGYLLTILPAWLLGNLS